MQPVGSSHAKSLPPSIMQTDIRAGIELDGSVLRYAEIEHIGERARLLRLGSCDFEFDLTEELPDAAPEKLATLGDALEDVFAGSKASSLSVAVHPPAGCYFFAPLPSGMPNAERQAHLKQQASFLMGDPPDLTPHVEDERLYTESLDGNDTVDWFYALVFSEEAYASYAELLDRLPFGSSRPVASMSAAAAVMRRLQGDEQPGSLYSLAVGVYNSHFEFTLCRGAQWRFAHHAPGGPPEDCAYYVAGLLNRMGVPTDDVERLYLYGRDVDVSAFDAVGEILPVHATRLDIFRALDHNPNGLSKDVSGDAYVTGIGAALREV